ncbi:S-layer homology domain-containing protein [Paenibacillus sp. PAMC21692]|uniref:S-layer homology domain-containing protein n=1 Tax=Paenibacillus sp. PAMC21692 TaxID=2762320 RepID=UPI00164E57F6|nr:S-layer homology domain-containing protein [Paenibacillus sp. PAMC21692]QNK55980.1 S-layer homology domain-containing protein [Paenibacillus sp. PAMC21692]
MKLKQFLSCITIILLVTGIFPLQVFAASDAAMTGDGSPANPYTVMTLEQLDAVRNNLSSHYKLGADIDASETAGWNGGEGFEPVGGNGNASSRFTGTFDGAGHVIQNLTVNRPMTEFVGLFGIVGSGGMIKDVGLVGGSITGNSVTGGLVGYGIAGSSISSSYSSVSVNGSVYVGGLTGRHDGAVSDSYATGPVSGTAVVGGLAGDLEGADVIRSYASGEVNASGGHAGGLAGINAGSTIIQSYAIGAVSGIDTAGGLVGMTDYGLIRQSYASGAVKGSGYAGGLVGSNNGALIEQSFWDQEAAGQSGACGNNTDGYGVTCPSTGLATMQALVPNSYSGWDFTNVWFMIEGSTRPFLRSEWSQRITNTHQLQLMTMNPGVNYTLARDIDFGTVFTDNNRSDMWATRHGEGSGFAPVGNMSNPYVAEFDGSNHLIGNMVINRPATDFVGLFGNLGSGGVVRNVGLEGGFVSGRSSTGALVGESYGGTIAQSYSSVDVSGTNNVGGVVGQNNIGGIVSQSFATGSIAGQYAVGGLVGRNERGAINDAYSTGFVNGISEVGGLAGRNVGSINRAYSVGKVTAAEGSVGGLVGRNFEPVISGRYNSQTSGHGDADKGIPRTTAEMKQRATFEPDWDFVHIWTIEEGKVYPALRDFIGNIGRDVAPPTVVSAVMDVEQPDRILLHFDEEVRLTDADGVMIESDGVGTTIIDVEGESTKILAFTVSDAFEQGAEVIFSYDALLGNIVDLAGNPMSSLAGQIVYKLPVIGIMMKKADASDYENGGWTNQSVTVIANVEAGAGDMAEFFYTLNGGLEQAYTNGSPIVITEEGTNSLTFQVTDRAGHTVSVELEVKIDKSPPSVIYAPSGSETQASSASPTVTADDAASGVNASTLQYVWTTDASPPSSGWTPFVSGTGLAKSGVDGDWYLHIRVSDAAGNESVRVSDRFRLMSRTGSEGGNSGAGGYQLPKGTYLVGMNGGTVTFDGGQIFFPADAISRTFYLKITEVADPNTLPLSDGQRLVSRVFEVTKDQAGEFDKDVSIHLQFDFESVRDEGTEVLLCWLNEETGQWMPLDNRKVDWEKGVAGGTTNHFTKFAVIAVTEEKAETDVRFTDIQGHWAEKSIVELAEKGALHGYTDGSFMPDLEITRAEFAVILVQALDYTDKEGKTFNDMANHWARHAVSTAHAYGVVHGYNDNTFAPDDPITREQMTKMIMNALQLETKPFVRTFADQNKISKWAREAVAAAAESGLIIGYPDNTIRPQAHATRAEAASLIGRLL